MVSLIHYDRDTIRINGKEYGFADFSKLEPAYSVPWGFPIRVYERGVRHYISDGSNTLYPPKIDPYCDRICSREGELARLVAGIGQEANGENS